MVLRSLKDDPLRPANHRSCRRHPTSAQGTPQFVHRAFLAAASPAALPDFAKNLKLHRIAENKCSLALAANERCDLLISDIGLPDGSGTDLMRELQKLYTVPGIAVTAHGDATHAKACEEAGFAKRLLKPVKFTSLLEAIGEIRPANATKFNAIPPNAP